jgi:hypothetical protein
MNHEIRWNQGYPNEPGILRGVAQRCGRALSQLKTRGVWGVDAALAQGQTILRSVKEHHLFAKGTQEKRQVLTRLLTEVGELVVHTRPLVTRLGQRRDRDEPEAARAPRPLPARPPSRPPLWLVDRRSLVKREGRWGARRRLLAGSSRLLLAGRAAEPQERPALLQRLLAALSPSGCPAALGSDHGVVVRAEDDGALRKARAIAPQDIARRQPWQHRIAAQWKGQRRLADFTCAQAGTGEERQR